MRALSVIYADRMYRILRPEYIAGVFSAVGTPKHMYSVHKFLPGIQYWIPGTLVNSTGM